MRNRGKREFFWRKLKKYLTNMKNRPRLGSEGWGEDRV
jgi:hypothetical protein